MPVALTRAHSSTIEIWTLRLQDALPVMPIPLRPPDPDAILDLSTVLHAIQEDAFYHLSLDYDQKLPPPELSGEE